MIKDKLADDVEEREPEGTEEFNEPTKHLDIEMKRLREIERLSIIGARTARIAHEIRNPLNSMFTASQFLEKLLARGEVNEAITISQDLQKEIRRLESLVSEIRDILHPRSLNLVSINLVELTDEILLQFTSTKGIEYERQFHADFPVIIADKEQLKGALINLFRNAIEAMPQGGKIILRGYVQEKTICIEVEDTGVGIPVGTKIFEPFSTSKNSGWGVGLVNVAQTIADHGGTIDYVSEIGRGTVFRMCLPAADKKSS
jgi:signal transduction histidine kinase